MMLGCRVIFLILACLLPTFAWGWPAVVAHIHDGDTLTVTPLKSSDNPIKIRLYGIDTPEKEQPGGADATAYLHSLLSVGVSVDVTEISTDKYGRTVAVVAHDGRIINELMVEAGHAWVYARYCRAAMCKLWYRLQRDAAAARRGLWREDTPLAPWIWRKAMRN